MTTLSTMDLYAWPMLLVVRHSTESLEPLALKHDSKGLTGTSISFFLNLFFWSKLYVLVVLLLFSFSFSHLTKSKGCFNLGPWTFSLWRKQWVRWTYCIILDVLGVQLLDAFFEFLWVLNEGHTIVKICLETFTHGFCIMHLERGMKITM